MAPASVREPVERKRARMKIVLKLLKNRYPGAKCSLSYRTPFQLLVSTVLSAQCTDARVNMTTPELFRRFPDAKTMAGASLRELEALVKPTGFYKNKALALSTLSKAILEKHAGEVPRTIEELTALRGVGRKTANVILGNAFSIPGMVVDTHVGRLSRRLGFTRAADPVKVEHELMEIVPRVDWTLYSHLLIDHGRAICQARRPRCEECFLLPHCPQVGVVSSEGK